MFKIPIFNSRFWNTEDEILFNFTIANASIFSHVKVTLTDACIQRYTRDESTHQWVRFWSLPMHRCDESVWAKQQLRRQWKIYGFSIKINK